MDTLQLEAKRVIKELELIKKSQQGDEQAFGELYEIWSSKVYRFVYLKTKHVPVAEDLTSEVFLKAWQKIHQYRPSPDARFSSWLYTIARNTVIDYYRVNKRVEISFENLPEIADLEGEEPYREATRIEEALERLPGDYAKVLKLRFVEEMPIARIAQSMKKKESNIRALTHRALKKLKEELEK